MGFSPSLMPLFVHTEVIQTNSEHPKMFLINCSYWLAKVFVQSFPFMGKPERTLWPTQYFQ